MQVTFETLRIYLELKLETPLQLLPSKVLPNTLRMIRIDGKCLEMSHKLFLRKLFPAKKNIITSHVCLFPVEEKLFIQEVIDVRKNI